MSVGLIFMMALVSVASFLILLLRMIGWRNIIKRAAAIDVIFTVMCCIVLAGSITGLLIGIVAGLVMTGALTIGKWVQGRVDRLRAARAADVTPADDWCPGGTPGRL